MQLLAGFRGFQELTGHISDGSEGEGRGAGKLEGHSNHGDSLKQALADLVLEIPVNPHAPLLEQGVQRLHRDLRMLLRRIASGSSGSLCA